MGDNFNFHGNGMGKEERDVNFELVDAAPRSPEPSRSQKADYDFWTSSYGGESANNASGNYASYGGYAAHEQGKAEGQKEKKGGFGKKLARAAAIAAVFGVVSGVAFQGTSLVSSKLFKPGPADSQNQPIAVTRTTADGTTTSTDVSALVKNAMPSMVSITSTIVSNYNYFGQTFSQEGEGSGSGIIVGKNDDQLLIVTNNHVIDGAKTISVCFIDKEIVQADVKGTDSSADLAVVAVDLKDIKEETLSQIKIATLGDSTQVQLGQMAVAIGNALGYGQSVTVGYISAMDRTVSVSENGKSSTTMNLLQTDAAINPGNSGGALLNMKGEVIGINSAKYADTDVEGMGYAIPISEAIPIINDLMNREVLSDEEKGYLGISGQDITEENNIYNMPTGVYVYKVAEEGAAKEAGIQQGDIIVKINGAQVRNMQEVSNKVNNTRIGTEVSVTVLRNIDGSYQEVELTAKLKGYDSLNSLQEAGSQGQPGQESQPGQQPDESPDNGINDFFGNFFDDFYN